MDLCITEKNEVAKDVRAAVGGSMRVVACSGHLLGLAEPKDVDERYASKSDMSVLPIVFDDKWPVVVRGAGGEWEDYYVDKVEDIREALAKGPDRVYCAGDADDEGQLIVDEVLRYLGYDPCDDMFWRVVINDNLPANIRRAFDEARPNREFYGNGLAAQARSLADFSFGVNESRLATHELKGQVHVGRVQTPTLGLVVARDRAIEGHVERLAYSLAAVVGTSSGEIAFSYSPADGEKEDGKHVFDRSLLDDDAAAVEGKGVSFAVSHKVKTENPPLPFNMVTLAAEMSRSEGMTAEQVMETTQSLRQKKLITYNRTDSQYLKEEHWEQAGDLIPLVAGNISSDLPCDPSIKSKAFNDAKIQAHHAIIPQATKIDGGMHLTKFEEAVYRTIAERYLAQFLPPRRYTEASAAFSVEGAPGTFKYKAVRDDDLGFKGYISSVGSNKGGEDDDGAGAASAFLAAGDYSGTVSGTSVTSKKTTPPKRYTDGTLMTDMSSIAKYVADPDIKALLVEKDANSPGEKGSIGTTATRASIIENLVKKGYLVRQGSKIVSSDLGRAVYDALPDDVRSVDTTARWYMIGKDIRDGAAPVTAVVDDVVEGFKRHRASRAYSGPGAAALEDIFAKKAAEKAGKAVGTCPLCGRRTVIRSGALRCEATHYFQGDDGKWVSDGDCDYFLKKYCGKQFTEKQLESLAAGKTVKVDGLISKKGSKFSARVHIKDDGRVEIVEFVNDPKKKGGARGKGKSAGPRRSPRPRR